MEVDNLRGGVAPGKMPHAQSFAIGGLNRVRRELAAKALWRHVLAAERKKGEARLSAPNQPHDRDDCHREEHYDFHHASGAELPHRLLSAVLVLLHCRTKSGCG